MDAHGNLVHIAQSGHWNMDVGELLAALVFYFDTEHADVVQYTEVSPAKFRGPVKSWCKRRGLYLHHPRRSGANECMTISTIPLNRPRSYATQVTKLRLKVGRLAPTFMLSTHVKGWGKFRFVHTPAHNQGLKPGLWPTRVYHSVMDGVHGLVMRRKGRETAGGDVNLNLKRHDVVTMLSEEMFPGLTYCGTPDQDPDLGVRLITGIWTNLKIVRPSVTLHRQPGHDHKGVLTVLGQGA